MQVENSFLTQLKQDITNRYLQKYGNVNIRFDEITQEDRQKARVKFTISNETGFITRHYGKAYYEGERLRLKTMAI
ncbi:MAG TPA: hypothetical protein VL461_11625 [Dictyobacter sp.]|jgi:hypothetical protein|nr:hypothetical protein [Dictyobacter sp.]